MAITHQLHRNVGEMVNTHKLDTKKVKEIRRLFATGEWSQAALGREYGVSQPAIYKIVKRQAWKHVK
jgi:hypothetical protein